MEFKLLIKKILSNLFSYVCLRNIKHGHDCKCNFYCKFTKKTIIGNKCHFNGIKMYGNGKIIIGNNFHSGKNIRILTSYHNFDDGKELPYDNTYNNRNIKIEDNVWIGDDVLILGEVVIGEGAVIQAGSVVCKDIPRLAVAGGHPAVPFKFRNKEHYFSIKKKSGFN